VDYNKWRDAVEQYVETSHESGKEEHALLGLYHMVTGDLPANTKAPELDDRNAADALRADKARTGQDLSGGSAVTQEIVGVYLAYLVARGFMPKPRGGILPDMQFSQERLDAMASIGGRGGASA